MTSYIVLFVLLRLTDSDYAFGIFKLFIYHVSNNDDILGISPFTHKYTYTIIIWNVSLTSKVYLYHQSNINKTRIMKRKFKQYWPSIPQISTNGPITSYRKSLNIKRPRHNNNFWNLGDIHNKCSELKRFNVNVLDELFVKC
jgi:hypothetical protein